MALLSRGSVALVLTSAFVLASACSSSNKKSAPPLADAGSAGEAGAPAAGGNAGEGGSGERPPVAGAAGESEGGAGGVAGAESVGGAAGDIGAAGEVGAAGEAGAAGSGALACVPQGSVSNFSFDTEPTYSVCRGGIGYLPFSSNGSDATFTCCGTSNAAYDFPLLGIEVGDGGGYMGFEVPADAPLTEQAVSATCTGDPITTTAGIKVTDTAPPFVGSVTEQISSNAATVQINGSHLSGVNTIGALSLDGAYQGLALCNIAPTSQTDATVTCSFGYLPAGQYAIIVMADSCGSITTPHFQVTST